jgi:hypothetical protein
MPMASLMSPGKRYRLRTDKDGRFVEGYFLDRCFYNDQNKPIGDLEADGCFRHRPGNHIGHLLKYFYYPAGKVEGLRLILRDGTSYDLVEVFS